MPSGLRAVLACATAKSSSSDADSQRISLVTLPSFTTRNGVSMNPRSLTRAKVERLVIRPMFGPSGVSIGHIRPYCE